MKIAFTSADCPAMDFQSIAAIANRLGFDGVELTVTNNFQPTESDVHSIFSDAGVRISAINIGSDFNQLPQRISLAADLNCNSVILKSDSVFSTLSKSEWIKKLLKTADIAASAGASILLENRPVAGSALQLWHLLDRLDHPSIACCWNTFDAALAGDTPAVAIPTLNSRIRYVILQDGQRNENALTECNPGEGNLPLRNTTNRLRGIGFDGWLRVGLAQTSKADESQLEQSLRRVLSALQQWQVLPTPVSAR